MNDDFIAKLLAALALTLFAAAGALLNSFIRTRVRNSRVKSVLLIDRGKNYFAFIGIGALFGGLVAVCVYVYLEYFQ